MKTLNASHRLGGRLAAAAIGLLAFAAADRAVAAVTVTALSESRTGEISAWDGCGIPGQACYVDDPGNPFGPISFEECVLNCGANACLDSNSAWKEYDPLGGTTTGFAIASVLSATGPGASTTFAEEQVLLTFSVSGLASGATTQFTFSGAFGPGREADLGSLSALLVGPGVNILKDTPGAWGEVVNLGNGTYSLEVQAEAEGSEDGTGVTYYVSLDHQPMGPECGDAEAGSCFVIHGGPFCNDVACCEAVCTSDAFCCATMWDSLCVAGAFTACYPVVPLCEGLGRDFQLSHSAEVPGFGLVAPTSQITIEFWQRLDGPSQNTVITCQSGLANRIVTHTPWTNGNIIFDFGAAFDGGRLEVAAPADLSQGWHHFAFVASTLEQSMRIYHNGELLGESASASSFSPVDVPLAIAGNFVGAVDELRIWNVARSAEQIAASFDVTVPPTSPNLVAYYRMDSTAENTLIVDLSNLGGAQHASLVGTPSFAAVSHELGICYPNMPLCDGLARDFLISEKAEVPGFGLVAPTSEITVEFWQLLDDGFGNRSVIECHESLTNRIITHTPWTNGNVIFDFGAAFGGGRLEVPAPPDLLGNWHHFAFVASNAGAFMRAYHNGHLVGEITSASGFSPTNIPLKIGSSFSGKVDELRIWNVVRTSEEICDTWSRTVSPETPGLIAYYRMDSAAETNGLIDLADLEGSSDAVITGAPSFIAAVPCPLFGDLDGDGAVDGADLGHLLSEWGAESSSADFNCDGVVDGADLGLLLAAWTS